MAIAHLLLKFDGHWITMVGAALWAHISKICIIGVCHDRFYLDFVPTISSTIFTFTVASLLAEYQIAGPLKRIPYFVRLSIEILLVLVIVNLALRLYWIPYLLNINQVINYGSKTMLTSKFRVVQDWHKWITENVNYESAYEGFNILIALSVFAIYVYVAEIVEFVCDMYVIERPGSKKRHGKSRRLQETPLTSKGCINDDNSPSNEYSHSSK